MHSFGGVFSDIGSYDTLRSRSATKRIASDRSGTADLRRSRLRRSRASFSAEVKQAIELQSARHYWLQRNKHAVVR